MRDPCTYDYAVIRVVPRVEREEFVNVGVIVSCPAVELLEARIEVDPTRLAALDPGLDLENLARHLDSIPLICRGGAAAGPIGRLPPRERFRWLTSVRSTMIQCSPVHTGRCDEARLDLDALMDRMVRTGIRSRAGAPP